MNFNAVFAIPNIAKILNKIGTKLNNKIINTATHTFVHIKHPPNGLNIGLFSMNLPYFSSIIPSCIISSKKFVKQAEIKPTKSTSHIRLYLMFHNHFPKHNRPRYILLYI